jgi:hypothetical protein
VCHVGAFGDYNARNPENIQKAKDAANDLKNKATSVLKGNSALPNSMAVVADLNADVRGLGDSYRDPATDKVQDKLQEKVGDKLGGEASVDNSRLYGLPRTQWS